MTKANGKSLTLEEMLAARDMTAVRVDCPEWGGSVYVLPFTGDQRDRWEQTVSAGHRTSRAELISWALCDSDGNRLSPSPAQVKVLGERNSGTLDRIFEKICEVSGMRGNSIAEEAEKN